MNDDRLSGDCGEDVGLELYAGGGGKKADCGWVEIESESLDLDLRCLLLPLKMEEIDFRDLRKCGVEIVQSGRLCHGQATEES
jgi:hypothetical protein